MRLPISYLCIFLSFFSCIKCDWPIINADNLTEYETVITALFIKINWMMKEMHKINETVNIINERQNNTKQEENINHELLKAEISNVVKKEIMEMKEELFQKFNQQENTIKTDIVDIKQEFLQKFDQQENWMTNSSDAIKKDIMEMKQEIFQKFDQQDNIIKTDIMDIKQELMQKFDQQENRMTNSSDAIKKDIMEIKQEFLQKYNQQENGMTNSSDAIKKDIMEIKQEFLQKFDQQENTIKTDILDIKQDFLQKFNQQEHLLTKSSTAIENFMGKSFNTTMESYDTTMKGFNKTIMKMLNPMRNWLVILRRQDGSENFDRNWLDYKNGFGHQNGEFFIGLDKLHAITTYGEAQELLFVLKDFENQTRYAKYDNFVVGNESEKYKIKQLGKYYGDVGDKFSHHLNLPFSTKDEDNDKRTSNCAEFFKGGWWFSKCYNVHLTGQYFDEHTPNGDLGIIWTSFHHTHYSLKFVEMMVRPKA